MIDYGGRLNFVSVLMRCSAKTSGFYMTLRWVTSLSSSPVGATFPTVNLKHKGLVSSKRRVLAFGMPTIS